ncbi:hypothetical protein [Streptomyces sp. NPDC059009]|uniref:hypothetical protein n=1 Tax=Streptomyces sp. NPDC059009 TaxID=3346694 RepID=UPI0036952977
MSAISKWSERHALKLPWIIVLGGAASVFTGDHLWRWAASLGPGAAAAFGAFCGSAAVCVWTLAAATFERRQWLRLSGTVAVGVVAFLALACLIPGRRRLTGSLALPDDQRMWVEEHPSVWWAIGGGVAFGALALWQAKRSARPPR